MNFGGEEKWNMAKGQPATVTQSPGPIGKAVNYVGNLLPRKTPSTLDEIKTQVTQQTPELQLAPSQAPQNILDSLVKPSQGVKYEDALPVVQKIIGNYIPKTPDVPQGWKSPLSQHTDLIARQSAQYGLDPRLLPLLAIAETQGLRPQASGTSRNNPFNTMQPGTQDLFPYPDIETAIRQYASGIGEPRYSAFKEKMNPNTTFRDFIGIQNPSDNPEQEMQVLLDLASQLGI
jgi:hypothetical protein